MALNLFTKNFIDCCYSILVTYKKIMISIVKVVTTKIRALNTSKNKTKAATKRYMKK